MTYLMLFEFSLHYTINICPPEHISVVCQGSRVLCGIAIVVVLNKFLEKKIYLFKNISSVTICGLSDEGCYVVKSRCLLWDARRVHCA